ncbi:ElyC/SanA/YdcF family protein [Nocardiopsis mangrovi]|uniref:ElyC/SanA/YdcF family protein n=1 Tax=Nocardiopsis mangrovi TaxID=1179818 RepID=A0ABV9DQE4_9ACTN
MRTAGDERGDGPPDGGPATPGPEATRAFTRGPSGAGDTAAHGRDRAPGAPPQGPSGGSDAWGGPADDLRTRTFTRPAGDAPGDRYGDAPGADRTRVFTRPAGGEPADPYEDDPGADRTRTFTRPETRRAPRGPARPPLPRSRPGRRRFRWGRLVALVVLVAIALPPGTWAWVWYTARMDDRPTSDAIVVLGASQYNGNPSPIFEARLQHAADLYAEGVAPVIVTVGGNQPGDNFTEAGSGRDWLVAARGVPAAQVVAIGEGSDTLQSIEAVARVFDDRGWGSAVIVSDPWHSLRSKVMADDFGIEAATSPSRSGPAVLERETQLWYITRETASLWYYWIFGDSSDIEVDAAS